MSFLTSYMEAMLAAATDPEEIALRQTVLNDQRQMEAEMAAKNEEASALDAEFNEENSHA